MFFKGVSCTFGQDCIILTVEGPRCLRQKYDAKSRDGVQEECQNFPPFTHVGDLNGLTVNPLTPKI